MRDSPRRSSTISRLDSRPIVRERTVLGEVLGGEEAHAVAVGRRELTSALHAPLGRSSTLTWRCGTSAMIADAWLISRVVHVARELLRRELPVAV